ncbi:Pre-mRNA splicing factor-domain-containing protein [Tricharina praecox]|uniref:Pre-mRNA splicing factor-domain-containing protein n=1 Tax=Tricharina praecox TaxID=43433 RepID=UPI00221EF795|nr:Pre-mRNA splicing factor-domain-containing protein [Tricharina praecox]KAI5849803.1 Pre-mRNA splicing factor-domain-containing protein [Tricharina praecox]
MGGDLNLKKSWHPQLLKNQKRVWEEEKRALDERKRTEQWKKEREEERQLQELRKIQEAAGGKKVLDRVDFLYSGPAQGMDRTSEEMEALLLGRRRIDGLLTGKDNDILKKDAGTEGFLKAPTGVANQRDIVAKVRDDPLLAIKRREQEALEAYMKDPTKRRKLQEARGVDDKKEKKERRHRHRHDGDEKDRHHRKRSRSHSRRRHRSRSPRRDKGRDDKEYRRRSRERTKRADSRERTKRADSRERSRRSDSRERSRKSDSRERRHRSRTPEKRGESHSHRHDDEKQDRTSPHSSRRQNDRRPSPPPRRPSPPPRPRYRSPPRHHAKATSNSVADEEAERARKLAAMQSNASSLDADRAKRLALLAEKEKAAAAAEEDARMRNNKYGGRAQFLNQAHRQAGEMDLGERVGRSRQGLIVGRDQD